MYYYLFSVSYKTKGSLFTNGSVLSGRSSYMMKKGFCLVIGILFLKLCKLAVLCFTWMYKKLVKNDRSDEFWKRGEQSSVCP